MRSSNTDVCHGLRSWSAGPLLEWWWWRRSHPSIPSRPWSTQPSCHTHYIHTHRVVVISAHRIRSLVHSWKSPNRCQFHLITEQTHYSEWFWYCSRKRELTPIMQLHIWDYKTPHAPLRSSWLWISWQRGNCQKLYLKLWQTHTVTNATSTTNCMVQ